MPARAARHAAGAARSQHCGGEQRDAELRREPGQAVDAGAFLANAPVYFLAFATNAPVCIFTAFAANTLVASTRVRRLHLPRVRREQGGMRVGATNASLGSFMLLSELRPTLPQRGRTRHKAVMNYRHAFHAGNFADVVKHVVLARILEHLRAKPAPFRVIDTHAGAGRYDLAGPEASRTEEWRGGIGRVAAARFAPDIEMLLAPYRDVIARFNSGARLSAYPGSCEIARQRLRAQDRLVACELEPGAADALARNLSGDSRVKAVAIDGWTALTAYVPPRERRGLVLIDPAFEQADEFARLAERFAAAYRKWPTGIYLLWYPIKSPHEPDELARRLQHLATPKVLRAELTVAAVDGFDGLAGSGLLIINPPWRLDDELAALLPPLAACLARDRAAAHRLDWLAREK
jgi:23S rRNA (adenine2030-N6)-methyltransferase